ncbi:DUF1835 domain-containing protein [Neobacillus sp. LXY-4]|uniref:DUF1835 domain-containing protein n=1 Tax=Neobacillus sp. LXY-4 TaxID=3379826 RepID=UPI003EDF3988
MIHILFGAAASEGFKVALMERGLDKKEQVISFWDIFSVGPVWQLHKENGVELRFEWMKNCISDGYEFLDYQQRYKKTLNKINSIPEGTHITIWTSENAHEQSGLRYVMFLLKEKNIDITVMSTTKAFEELFPVKKVKYTPLDTGEISPEKLQIIYEKGQGQFLSDHDKEQLQKDWLSLSENQGVLRIWRNGRIHSVPEDYYDELMIKRAKKLHGKQNPKAFMKSARLIGDMLGHVNQYIGDAFLEYRLKKLIEKGIFESEGSLEAMRYYSVKLR